VNRVYYFFVQVLEACNVGKTNIYQIKSHYNTVSVGFNIIINLVF